MVGKKKIGHVKVPAGHLAYVDGKGDVIARPLKRRKGAKKSARKSPKRSAAKKSSKRTAKKSTKRKARKSR